MQKNVLPQLSCKSYCEMISESAKDDCAALTQPLRGDGHQIGTYSVQSIQCTNYFRPVHRTLLHGQSSVFIVMVRDVLSSEDNGGCP